MAGKKGPAKLAGTGKPCPRPAAAQYRRIKKYHSNSNS
jgi:hypothetical protein